MRYVPALDGVRALAIVAVIGFHLMPHAFCGGFTGVDIFFVLSGYLITSVILHDLKRQRFSMQEFYLRRVQRLLPNAVLMILVTLFLLRALLSSSMAYRVAAHGIWALLNVSNLYIWRPFGGHWGDSAASPPLLHTWSLAVEEQFYLFFPATVCLLARRRGLFPVTALLTLASFALCVYVTHSHPGAAFNLLPTRAWEPLLGGVLAIYRIPLDPSAPLRQIVTGRAAAVAGALGLALIFAGFILLKDGDRFPGALALYPTIGTFLLLCSLTDESTAIGRLFSASPFVYTGRASYSLYLWHWPMMFIGGMLASLNGRPEQEGRLVGLAVGILLALLAYHFVETPFRQRGPKRRLRLVALAAAFSVCFGVCLAMSWSRPIADSRELAHPPIWKAY